MLAPLPLLVDVDSEDLSIWPSFYLYYDVGYANLEIKEIGTHNDVGID